jgi:hypothetical protein
MFRPKAGALRTNKMRKQHFERQYGAPSSDPAGALY